MYVRRCVRQNIQCSVIYATMASREDQGGGKSRASVFIPHPVRRDPLNRGLMSKSLASRPTESESKRAGGCYPASRIFVSLNSMTGRISAYPSRFRGRIICVSTVVNTDARGFENAVVLMCGGRHSSRCVFVSRRFSVSRDGIN